MTMTTPVIPDVMPEPAPPQTPGGVFADAVAAHGLHASVEFDTTITAALASLRRKPRYPARNLFKVVDLSRQPRRFYWHESPPPADVRVGDAGIRPELISGFHKSPIPGLLPTTAWVQVPEGLWEDAEAFQSFVDGRLVFRLGTAENHALIAGEGGLLHHPDIARLTDRGPFATTIFAACNEIEQMGCTPDGMIINPADYYRLMSGTLMQDLEQHGLLVVRTRLVGPGVALVGDFAKGAQLFDAGRSVIRFAEPPPGTFPGPGIGLMAQIHERVVVNLPTNFYVVSL